MKPRRVQLRRTKGWRMPENTVKVDRTTAWGNPFHVDRDGSRAECVRLFQRLLKNDAPLSGFPQEEQRALLDQVQKRCDELRGKNLACGCPLDGPCPADVLLNYCFQVGE